MKMPTAAVAIVAMVLIAANARTVCIEMPLPDLLRRKDIEVIVRATARGVRAVGKNQIATLDVTRIWKGRIGSHLEIYNMDVGDESINLLDGGDYFVTGYRLSAADRAEVGLPADAVALGTNGCSATPFTRAIPRLRGMPGRVPRPGPAAW